MQRILLIENDAETQHTVTVCCATLGAALETSAETQPAWAAVQRADWALLLLAAAAPGVDGLSLLRRLRTASRVPVLLLIAAGAAVDGILGLELGADVYLTKPVNERALLAQMRALLRRTRDEAYSVLPPPLQRGALALDEQLHLVSYAGQRLELTLSEFDLLRLLLRADGGALARETLSQQLLGRACSPTDRSLDVHISNLRRKLAVAAGQDGAHCIRAVRGVGYALTLR